MTREEALVLLKYAPQSTQPSAVNKSITRSRGVFIVRAAIEAKAAGVIVSEESLEENMSVRKTMHIRCTCGASVALADAMTNQCQCGRLYNGCGQELADPQQWGRKPASTGGTFGETLGLAKTHGKEIESTGG